MSDLTSLRERIGKATGADRALDRDLWEAITGECTHRRTHYVELENDEHELECADCAADTYGADKWSGLTSSLDQALALVEAKLPGRDVSVRTRRKNPYQGDYPAEATIWGESKFRESHGAFSGFAQTLTLALLSALLAALSEQRT